MANPHPPASGISRCEVSSACPGWPIARFLAAAVRAAAQLQIPKAFHHTEASRADGAGAKRYKGLPKYEVTTPIGAFAAVWGELLRTAQARIFPLRVEHVADRYEDTIEIQIRVERRERHFDQLGGTQGRRHGELWAEADLNASLVSACVSSASAIRPTTVSLAEAKLDETGSQLDARAKRLPCQGDAGLHATRTPCDHLITVGAPTQMAERPRESLCAPRPHQRAPDAQA